MAVNPEQLGTLRPRSVTEVPGHPAELWQCCVPEEAAQAALAALEASDAWGDESMRVLLVEKGFAASLS